MRYLLVAVVLALSVAAFAGDGGKVHAGFGYGDQYGKLGANFDYRLTEQISATAGVGLNGEGGWFGGVRYYMQPAENASRGRVSVGVANINPGESNEATKVFISIGWTWANAKNKYSGPSVDVSTAGRVSIGWQF
jgi:hypothetical protein